MAMGQINTANAHAYSYSRTNPPDIGSVSKIETERVLALDELTQRTVAINDRINSLTKSLQAKADSIFGGQPDPGEDMKDGGAFGGRMNGLRVHLGATDELVTLLAAQIERFEGL